jgi:hypothetical protein
MWSIIADKVTLFVVYLWLIITCTHVHMYSTWHVHVCTVYVQYLCIMYCVLCIVIFFDIIADKASIIYRNQLLQCNAIRSLLINFYMYMYVHVYTCVYMCDSSTYDRLVQ